MATRLSQSFAEMLAESRYKATMVSRQLHHLIEAADLLLFPLQATAVKFLAKLVQVWRHFYGLVALTGSRCLQDEQFLSGEIIEGTYDPFPSRVGGTGGLVGVEMEPGLGLGRLAKHLSE